MSKNYSHTNGFQIYRRLIKYIFRYWPAFVIAMIGNIAYSGIDSSVTYMLKPILNKGFIARDMHFVHYLPFLVMGAFLVRAIMNIMSSYFMARVSNGVVMDFRQQIFSHLMKLPASFFDNASSGQILAVIIYNVGQVTNAGSDALTTLVQSFCLVIGLLVVMFTISWQLSLIFITTMPMIAVIVHFSSRRLRKISLKLQEQMGDVTSIAEEGIEGYKVVRAFGGQEYETKKFNKVTYRNYMRQLKVVVTNNISVSLVQVLAAIVLSVIIYLATSHHSPTVLSAGGFVAMLAAMLAILKPLKNFTKVNTKIQQGLAGAQSIFELLDRDAEQDTGTVHLKRARGEIEYKDISFTYPGTEKQVLNNISFSVAPGQSIALVGRSGSGKSTLINILQRFYLGWSGNLMLDNQPIENYVLAEFRQQFSTVSQQVTLFNDTVAHNVTYGSFSEVTEEQIIEAAQAANAWEFIKDMPKGLNTLIGENGVLLSGGQRQRIAIARAILKNAPILILDEATSSLDTESERQIQEALDKLMKSRTTLIIAHRLSTIENADLIVVMNEGKMLEVGKHDELLAKNGAYSHLYHLQFRDHKDIG